MVDCCSEENIGIITVCVKIMYNQKDTPSCPVANILYWSQQCNHKILTHFSHVRMVRWLVLVPSLYNLFPFRCSHNVWQSYKRVFKKISIEITNLYSLILSLIFFLFYGKAEIYIRIETNVQCWCCRSDDDDQTMVTVGKHLHSSMPFFRAEFQSTCYYTH